MKVTKEQKALFNFLKLASGILKNDNGEGILFVEEGVIFFGTYTVSGSIKIQQESLLVYEEMNAGFYDLSKTVKQDFKMDKVNEKYLSEGTKEEYRIMKTRIFNSLSKGKYLLEINEKETCMISKISNESNNFIRDIYISLMKELKCFDVYESDGFIQIVHKEVVEKENQIVTITLSMYCDKTKTDEYNQERLKV